MNKMVIVLASAAVPEGLTLTVGQITWTTRGGGLMTTTSEETQIQSGATTASTPITPTPTTRPLLPRYRGKMVDNSDLFRALDRADLRLLEASRLVDGISRRSDQVAPTYSFDSCRPTRVITQTAGDVSDNNVHPHGAVRRAQGRSRPDFSLRTKQLGRSLLTAHPIPFQQGGLVAETEQPSSSP
jgi:hypothetical protein